MRLVDMAEEKEVHIYDVNAVVAVTVCVETELEYLIFVSVTVVRGPPADAVVVCMAVVVVVAVPVAVAVGSLVSVSVVLTVDVNAPLCHEEASQCVDSMMDRATTAAARTPMQRPSMTLTVQERQEESRLSLTHALTARWLSGPRSCISYALAIVFCSGT